jgi:hypothetical protein
MFSHVIIYPDFTRPKKVIFVITVINCKYERALKKGLGLHDPNPFGAYNREILQWKIFFC